MKETPWHFSQSCFLTTFVILFIFCYFFCDYRKCKEKLYRCEYLLLKQQNKSPYLKKKNNWFNDDSEYRWKYELDIKSSLKKKVKRKCILIFRYRIFALLGTRWKMQLKKSFKVFLNEITCCLLCIFSYKQVYYFLFSCFNSVRNYLFKRFSLWGQSKDLTKIAFCF